MSKLSVVISAYNEEEKIKDCLESVKWADEIILVDNSSSDKTRNVAKNYTSKIFKKENNLMLNINKNFGFTKATCDWILSLDADERVTSELALEIKYQMSNIKNEEISGYWIPRKNIIFGKWIEYMGWYPDYQLRLIRRTKGKYPERHVHEMIAVEGETAHLKENIIHYNFETVSQFLRKHIVIYAPNEASELLRKGYNLDWKDLIRFPLNEFLSRFFARKGYKEGFHGLIISMLMAFYHLVIFALIWEKKGFDSIKVEKILDNTEKELKKSHKEIMYWVLNEKIERTKNLVSKTYLKVKKRFL